MTLAIIANANAADGGARMYNAAYLIGPFMGVFFVAFAVSFAMTPLMRWLAVRNGIVDWPDHKRKSHVEPVAYLGGVALFAGWLSAVMWTYFNGISTEKVLDVIPQGQFPITIVLGAAAIVITGLCDDIYGICPNVKIAGQIFAAGVLAYNKVATGLVDDLFILASLPVPPLLVSYSLATVGIAVLVVGGCNAMNLLDGLDGLAAGIAAIASIGFLVMAVLVALTILKHATPQQGMDIFPVIIIMGLATLGALLGFLPYNFHPANIFMGDAGSLLLGYLSVATILLFAEVPAVAEVADEVGLAASRGPLYVMAALIVFGVPICDTALAIFRRKLRGKPIFSPDDQHIHHLLVRVGYGVKGAVGVMYGLGVLFAVLGCTLVVLNIGRFVIAVFLVMFAFVMVTAYKYGHRDMVLEKLRMEGDGHQPAADATGDPSTEAAAPPSGKSVGPPVIAKH